MGNPNETAMYLPRPYPTALTPDWRKYIIHGATPNDTRLDFSMDQKSLIPRTDLTTYDLPSYPKPNTGTLDENADLAFMQLITPKFPIWVEKIKICLHQETTYGCVKVNVWDFGDEKTNIPVNLVGVTDPSGVAADDNIPLTIFPENKLVSNALADPDLYMVETGQTCFYDPFGYTIQPSSVLRFGVQYAEGNAYGLKIFLIGWMLECDVIEEEEEDIESSSSESEVFSLTLNITDVVFIEGFNQQTITIPASDKGFNLSSSTSTVDTYLHEGTVGGRPYSIRFASYKDGFTDNYLLIQYWVTDNQSCQLWYYMAPPGVVYGTFPLSQDINSTGLSPTVTVS